MLPYATEGCPSIPPERLLRAALIQAFYSVRSEHSVAPRPGLTVKQSQFGVKLVQLTRGKHR